MRLTGNCFTHFCSEFKLKNFGFDYDHLDQFYRSQWQSGDRSWLYLIYRWIWALFFVAVIVSCLILQFSEGKYFIFLTNWGIITCLLTQVTAAILVTHWHFDIASVRSDFYNVSSGQSKKTPRLIKFYWLIQHVALLLALVITSTYWTFLHGQMNKPQRFPAISFVTHCLNSVFMLVDFFIVAFPVRLMHTIYAMLLPTFFCLFTVIYYFCGGTDDNSNPYVYPILNWAKPKSGIFTFIGVFALYVFYAIILFAFFKFKRFLHRSFSTVWSPHCVGLI